MCSLHFETDCFDSENKLTFHSIPSIPLATLAVSPAIRERLATILPVVETKKQEEKAARKRLKEEKKKEKQHREEGRKKEEHATAQAEHVAKCKVLFEQDNLIVCRWTEKTLQLWPTWLPLLLYKYARGHLG